MLTAPGLWLQQTPPCCPDLQPGHHWPRLTVSPQGLSCVGIQRSCCHAHGCCTHQLSLDALQSGRGVERAWHGCGTWQACMLAEPRQQTDCWLCLNSHTASPAYAPRLSPAALPVGITYTRPSPPNFQPHLPAGRRPACAAAPALPCRPHRMRGGSHLALIPGRATSSRSSPPARGGNAWTWSEVQRLLASTAGEPFRPAFLKPRKTPSHARSPKEATAACEKKTDGALAPTLPLRSRGCGRSISLPSAAAAAGWRRGGGRRGQS